MPGGLDHPPIVIAGSRRRAGLLLLGALAFMAGGFVLVARAETPLAALAPLAFFAACAAAALLMVLEPPRLEIGPAGIAQRTIWGVERLAWRDVQDFRPATLGVGASAVGFDVAGASGRRGWLERLNLAVAGVEGMLQPGYAMAPHALADLLNEARERWLAESDAAAPASRAAVPTTLAGYAGARMGRKVFAIAWLALMATALGVSRVPGLDWAASAVVLVFGAHLYAVRLHDLGRSGWWQLGLYAAQSGIVGAMSWSGSGAPQYGLALAGALQLIVTATLAALPGHAGANRFGPAPGQPSAIAQAETFR